MRRLPEKLYRYRPPGTFTNEIFVTHRLHFCEPASLNDPFDCQIPVVLRGSTKEETGYLHRILRERGIRGAKRIELVHRYRNSAAYRQENMAQLTRDATAGVGLLCLSEIPDHMLMWSHYAAGHRGVCLEFSTSTEPQHQDPYHRDNLFVRPMEVVYAEDIPQKHPWDPPQELLEAHLLTKAAIWAYEREWRIVEHRLGPGNHDFRPRDLTGIVLGLNVDDKMEREICELVEQSEANPILYRARKASGRFAVEIRPI